MKKKLSAVVWSVMWSVMVVEQVPVRAVGVVEEKVVEEKKKTARIGKVSSLSEAKGSEGISKWSRLWYGEELMAVRGEEENGDEKLLEALKRCGKEGIQGLERYVEENPGSRWEAGVKYRLGLEYRRGGYMSQAIKSFEEAWAEVKGDKKGSRGHELGRRMVGDLVELSARMDRQERLGEIFKEIEGWELEGRSKELVSNGREGLWRLKHEPEATHKCGAMALYRLRDKLGIKGAYDAKIREEKSSSRGMNLARVQELAQELGMGYQMAYREAGAEVITPAVVHWKWDHYSAVVGEAGCGLYEVEDPTFFGAWQARKEVFEKESSGYWLVPAGELPPGWRKASEKEAAKVWGKAVDGSEGDSPDTANTEGGPQTPEDVLVSQEESGDCSGMPVYRFQAMKCGLSIRDVPLKYEGGRGPRVPFGLEYTQKDKRKIPSTGGVFGQAGYVGDCGPLGPKFEFDWEGYVYVHSSVELPPPGLPPPQPAKTESFHGPGGVYREQRSGPLIEGGTIIGLYGTLNGKGDKIAGGVMAPSFPGQPLHNGGYTRTYKDGSQEVYGFSEGAIVGNMGTCKYHLSKIIDAHGNEVSINWESDVELIDGEPGIVYEDPNAQPVIEVHTNVRVASFVKEGQISEYHYWSNDKNDGAAYYRVKEIVDPFGRKAKFEYDEEGVLIGITDAVGLQSSFVRAENGDVEEMSTPYGVTHFERQEFYGVANNHLNSDGTPKPRTWRYIQATDEGGTQRMEYAEGVASSSEQPMVPGETFPGVGPKGNTYFWDRKMWAEHPGDYSKAKSIQWLSQLQSGENVLSDYKASEKMPLESRVWYRYPGQGSGSPGVDEVTAGGPSVIAQVVNGVSEYSQREYNADGQVTKSIDAQGREVSYEYDGIDLVKVRVFDGSAPREVKTIVYNGQHLPVSVTGADGQTSTMSYNGQGQVTGFTTPDGQVTTMSYDGEGYLVQMDPPGDTVLNFGYEKGQVAQITNEEGSTIHYEYDNLDRLVKVNFPDGSYVENIYDRLDVCWQRDREGRWSRTWFNSRRQPVASQDANGEVSQLEWCGCGGLEKMIDPQGHVTTWVRDLQGRQTSKVYADGKVESTEYDQAGRPKKMTGINGAITTISYNQDGSVGSTEVSNAGVGVGNVYKSVFAYDEHFPRLTQHTDFLQGGGEKVTSYGYYPYYPQQLGSGRLASMDGPQADDLVSYSYDNQGRVVNRNISGVANTIGYDSNGKVSSVTNALGAFGFNYEGGRLESAQYPNGTEKFYGYDDAVHGRRLKSITLQSAGGNVLSKHGFIRGASGRINQWNQSVGATTKSLIFDYDNSDQLIGVIQQGMAVAGNPPPIEKAYQYGYDGIGNMVWENEDGEVKSRSHNEVNELTSIQGGSGSVRVKGKVSKAASVKVGEKAVAMDENHVFQATVPVSSGINTVPVKMTDTNGAVTESQVQFSASGSGTETLTYDVSGNLLSDGTTTYEWNGLNRLIKVTKPGGKTIEFTYDGKGQMNQLIEKTNGNITSQKEYLWVGNRIVTETEGTTKKWFLPQGFKVSTAGASALYFYGKDHLGSIREILDSQGNVVTRYDYSAHGVRTKLFGTVDSTFGYAGYLFNEASGLNLTWFRAQHPGLNRWLSRDPIREAGGVNLYAYVGNNPVNATDPLGLTPAAPAAPAPWWTSVGAGATETGVGSWTTAAGQLLGGIFVVLTLGITLPSDSAVPLVNATSATNTEGDPKDPEDDCTHLKRLHTEAKDLKKQIENALKGGSFATHQTMLNNLDEINWVLKEISREYSERCKKPISGH